MDSARTASFPHSNIGNPRSFHRAINGWYSSPQYGRHTSIEAIPPHHSVTTASSTGYSIHPSCGCSLESFLCLQDQYLLRYPLLLFRNGEGTHLKRWTTMRPLYREVNYTLLIWTFKATRSMPENALEESTQERTRKIPHHRWHPHQGGTEGSNGVPQLRVDTRHDSPHELVSV